MFEFNENLYCDVRIEREVNTIITYSSGELEENKEQVYCGVFIRVFDGDRWYYSSVTDEGKIQGEIDTLSAMAKKNKNINENPIVKKFQVNKYNCIRYKQNSFKDVPNLKKVMYIKSYFNVMRRFKEITSWVGKYIDKYAIREFYSSKGTSIVYDLNLLDIIISASLKHGNDVFTNRWQKSLDSIEPKKELRDSLKDSLEEAVNFVKNAESIIPGEYTTILSPMVAGIFAHESFGHRSEADFIIGDESMDEEWKIGKLVSSDMLSIIDDGDIEGCGYTPFDDEGNKSSKTYLINKGKLTGRLHDTTTAAILDEEVTGNGRAISFEFDPIPRMTNTYIEKGESTFEELISGVKDGVFIKDIKQGSGMSKFTLGPTISYRIRDGKLAEPLKISVVTGDVFETLNLIDGLGNEVEMFAFGTGGCGKFEQYPLLVGFGGPYVRIKKLLVQ